MKYIVMLVMGMLLFSGCSQKEPEAIAEAVITDKVSTENSGVKKTFNLNDPAAVQSKEAEVIVNYEPIYFDFDQSKIRENQEVVFNTNFQIMHSTTSAIRLEGNCDEFGSDEYNMALGLQRAKTIKDALVANGIMDKDIFLVSFGESSPVCLEKTVDCYQQNRRVDFRIID